MARALVRTPTAVESIKDFRYQSVSQILMPASSILIGTGNTLQDAILYTASDLTFDFANGAANLGLDTGTEAQDQWYALYAVPLTGTTYTLRASIQPPPQAGGTGPTGFTKYRYLGVFRNGGNGYDTTAGYGRGDIARFIKVKDTMYWQHFNSTNGGQYPAAPGTQGVCVYIANTSTNGAVFDSTTAANWGFTGLGSAGIKLPYRYATYLWEAATNTAATLDMRFEDNSGNNRKMVTGAANANATPYFAEGWQAFSQVDTWVSRISLYTNNNANVSRILGARGMVDPYLSGDNT